MRASALPSLLAEPAVWPLAAAVALQAASPSALPALPSMSVSVLLMVLAGSLPMLAGSLPMSSVPSLFSPWPSAPASALARHRRGELRSVLVRHRVWFPRLGANVHRQWPRCAVAAREALLRNIQHPQFASWAVVVGRLVVGLAAERLMCPVAGPAFQARIARIWPNAAVPLECWILFVVHGRPRRPPRHPAHTARRGLRTAGTDGTDRWDVMVCTSN